MGRLGAAALPRGPRHALVPSKAAVAPGRGRAPRPLLLVACSALAAAGWCCGGRLCWSSAAPGSRRGALAAAAAGVLAVGASDADAFPNAARQYKRDVNDPKKPGPQPGDLGLEQRFGFGDVPAVKECDNPPNCFTTTVKEGLDDGLHDLKPWTWTGKSPKAAMDEVKEVISAYEPGQQGIDGGGFAIKASGDDYVYTQFESLRRGHIDDVEFFVAPGTAADAQEGKLLIRSASRIGFYDFGVNAMRLNTLSEALAKKGGWKVDRIDVKSHPRYWGFNCDGGDGRRAPFNVRERWPEMCVNEVTLAQAPQF